MVFCVCLTAAQGASHARGKPLAQLLASEQQTLFSWSVMPLSKHAAAREHKLSEERDQRELVTRFCGRR